MKFKYNDKTYVVFATAIEIINQELIIKVEDNFLELSVIVLNSSYRDKHCIKEEALIQLTTTQVLKCVVNKKCKILQAYEVEVKDKEVDSLSCKFFTGEVTDILKDLQCFENYKIEYNEESNHDFKFKVLGLLEETEQEILDRVRYKCDYNVAKYYEP